MKQIKQLLPYVIIIVAVILIRVFIATPVVVVGSSMDPTLKDSEVAIMNKLDKKYNRFDIIVFEYKNEKLVKRIIGLPGETIRYTDGKLYVNNKYIDDPFASITADYNLSQSGYTVIPKNTYFVMGDNRNNSTDSRIIGVVKANIIEGKPVFCLFPFNKIGKIG